MAVTFGCRGGRDGVEGVIVRPQRGCQYESVLKERADRGGGQTLLSTQIFLELIQPYHQPCWRISGQLDKRPAAGWLEQPPVWQQFLNGLVQSAGLADRGSSDQEHESTRCGCR